MKTLLNHEAMTHFHQEPRRHFYLSLFLHQIREVEDKQSTDALDKCRALASISISISRVASSILILIFILLLLYILIHDAYL